MKYSNNNNIWRHFLIKLIEIFVVLICIFWRPGAFLVVGVLAFPGGWSDPSVQEVCGPSARHFYPGQCGLRWAYILAMIGVADVLVLAALAFTLAVRHVKLLSLQPYPIIYKGTCHVHQRNSYYYNSTGFSFAGEVNQGYANDGHRSRRSSTNTISGQSVAMFPHPNEVHDRMSEYGTPQHRPGHRSMNKPPSSHSYRPEYSANQHRFHLWGNIKIPIWSTDLVNKTNSTIFFTHYNNFIALYPQTHTPTLTICLIMSIWMYYVYINNKNFFFFLTFCFLFHPELYLNVSLLLFYTQWILSSTFYLLFFDWLFFSRQNLKNTRKWKIDFFEEEEKHFWLCENFVWLKMVKLDMWLFETNWMVFLMTRHNVTLIINMWMFSFLLIFRRPNCHLFSTNLRWRTRSFCV